MPADTLKTNLPIALTSFIGRERELPQVKELLSTTHLLTLTGAGGCGKTRLALQVAGDVLDNFLDGVWFCDLGPLSDPTLIPQTLASVFDLRAIGETTLIDLLKNNLRAKNLLLVLDNCEHLIDACAQLATLLLQHCPALQVLATSREALNIAGEVAWIVPSLEFPTPTVQTSISTLEQYGAVHLFVERARAVQPKFKLTRQNVQMVAQICRRVDGIPLAIELAAARVKALSVDEIAARLDDALRLLVEGKRGAPQRHQTLRATMDWSYDLLSTEEQILFRRLSVFTGGFTLAATEAICSDDGLVREEILDVLAHLVDKSLVVRLEGDGQVRYRLLEPIAQYARQKLDPAGEGKRLRNRHLAFFSEFVDDTRPRIHGAEAITCLAQLESEHNNLRAALAWSQAADERCETALILASAMNDFWFIRGYLGEGRTWIQDALAMANRVTPGTEHASEIAKTLPLVHSVKFQRARAQALQAAGVLARAQGDHVSALPLLETSLLIFRELADNREMPSILLNLAMVVLLFQDYPRARSLLQECHSLACQVGDQRRIIMSNTWLGNLLRSQGDLAAARTHYEQAITLCHELGNILDLPWPLYQLGCMTALAGDHARASSWLASSLALFRENGDQRGIGESLAALGDVYRWQFDHGRAECLYQEGLVLNQKLNIKWAIVWCLNGLGWIALYAGNDQRAITHFREGLALRLDKPREGYTTMCLTGIASVLAKQKNRSSAILSAQLFAAAESRLPALRNRVPLLFRSEFEQPLDTLHNQLDNETFDAAWAQGHALTMEQAIILANQAVLEVPKLTGPLHDISALTPRELEVLRLLAQGLSDAQIAEKLVISRRTVNTHLTAIYGKLGVNSRSAATRYALDHKLT